MTVRPQQPLLDWINALYPDNPVDEIEEGTAYLIPSKDSEEDIQNWLKRNFDRIFQNELNDWHTDPADWPDDRTYEVFTQWFDVSVYPMVLDVEKGRLAEG